MNHFDSQRRKVKRDFYDVRGFLSCSRILVDKQQTLCEFFSNAEGDTKLEKYFSYKGWQTRSTKNYCLLC